MNLDYIKKRIVLRAIVAFIVPMNIYNIVWIVARIIGF